TRILDRGANLSGGQRQRIALARAVAADAPVLVLHDPTTAVDAVTEQNIAEALIAARRRTDRATLLVTRAPALLQEVDRVVFMRGGAIVTEGPHQDLMGCGGDREVGRRLASPIASARCRPGSGPPPPPAASWPSARSCCRSPMRAPLCASWRPGCGSTGSPRWPPW